MFHTVLDKKEKTVYNLAPDNTGPFII
jgi:hypothetical protein